MTFCTPTSSMAGEPGYYTLHMDDGGIGTVNAWLRSCREVERSELEKYFNIIAVRRAAPRGHEAQHEDEVELVSRHALPTLIARASLQGTICSRVGLARAPRLSCHLRLMPAAIALDEAICLFRSP